MRSKLSVLVTALLAACTLSAQGKDVYPAKPIKLVVPFAAGGASDAIARPVAQAMQDLHGMSVVVENRPGAAGNIAIELVARSSPDGYTLLLGNTSTNAMNQASYAHVWPGRRLHRTMSLMGSQRLVGATAVTP